MEENRELWRYYCLDFKRARVILLLCGILYTYDLHAALGDFNALLFGFSIPAFYIISGYLVLRESPNREMRILRAIKRTAICFGILFVAYLGLSLLMDWQGTIFVLQQKAFWIDFLLLNTWSLPIGSTIWYVQAMLYAYIIIFALYKLKLLRFDIVIAALCLAAGLLSGELSAIVGFSFLGHSYLGGNFITRALPYLLIGAFIQRKEEALEELDSDGVMMIAFSGIILMVVEYLLIRLSGKGIYCSHLLGMGVEAVAFFLYVVFMAEPREDLMFFLEGLPRIEVMIPYFVCSPIYYVLARVFMHYQNEGASGIGFIGMLTALFSFVAAGVIIYGIRKWKYSASKDKD